MSKQRAKGTQWESELLPILQGLFGPQVGRAGTILGANDRGDFTGVPWLHEAKHHALPRFQEWARVCERKANNDWVVVWHGDRRKGAGHGPYVLMPLEMYERLVRGD